MNKLIIIGNLCKDPESRNTNDGKSVCHFTVAVNRRQRDSSGNVVADFFRISAWGKMGENCQKYLSKGKKVCVTGQVSVHAYSGNNGEALGSLEVFAEDVEFLSSANSGGQDGAQQSAPAAPAQAAEGTPGVYDDLPF